ncbi:MAG: DUF456 domain-containing protein [Phycisphaeraceae bacterium]|nr:DUF456 domain-containing protein [Phycisphaeraceae bacterium]
MDWLNITIGGSVVIAALVGVLLTAATLPGIWFMLLCAGLAQWWSMTRGQIAPVSATDATLAEQLFSPPVVDAQMFSWWSLGAVAIIAVIGEITDFASSAVGAAKAGGTRRGAVGSIIGAIVGAIAGTPLIPIPVLGTILGAAIGAGLGALIAERHAGRMTWKQAGKVGSGAAVGRLVSILIKTALALIAAGILIVDAFV